MSAVSGFPTTLLAIGVPEVYPTWSAEPLTARVVPSGVAIITARQIKALKGRAAVVKLCQNPWTLAQFDGRKTEESQRYWRWRTAGGRSQSRHAWGLKSAMPTQFLAQ